MVALDLVRPVRTSQRVVHVINSILYSLCDQLHAFTLANGITYRIVASGIQYDHGCKAVRVCMGDFPVRTFHVLLVIQFHCPTVQAPERKGLCGPFPARLHGYFIPESLRSVPSGFHDQVVFIQVIQCAAPADGIPSFGLGNQIVEIGYLLSIVAGRTSANGT